MALRHKYRAKPTKVDNIRFPSLLESRYYTYLKQLKTSGEIIQFLRQVPFHLPGNTKYVVDFQVFWKDGTVEFIDVKGMETNAFIKAKKQVEDLYAPIEIKVVKKGEF